MVQGNTYERMCALRFYRELPLHHPHFSHGIVEKDMKVLQLSSSQWKILVSAFSNISQAIILFALAALFVPETVGLAKNFSRFVALGYSICGLIMLGGAVILAKKGK